MSDASASLCTSVSDCKPNGTFSALDEAEQLNTNYLEFSSQYTRTSDLGLLLQALDAIQGAVDIVTNSVTAKHERQRSQHAGYLNNLGRCCRLYFEATNELHFLARAIDAGEMSLNVAKQASPLRSLYSINLSESLASRCLAGGRTCSEGDICRTLELAREAAMWSEEAKEHENDALATLASRLSQILSHISRDGQYLKEAIDIERKLIDKDCKNRAVYLFNLAEDLCLLFARYGSQADLLEACASSEGASHQFGPKNVHYFKKCPALHRLYHRLDV